MEVMRRFDLFGASFGSLCNGLLQLWRKRR